MTFRVVMLAFLIFLPLSGYGAIYGYMDENGVYHFTNITPIGKKFQTVIPDKEKVRSHKDFNPYFTDNSHYDTLILRHSERQGIDPTLVKAVLKAESNFNPHAVSNKGAQGLMQLMPDTAKLMKVQNPFDPDENIRGGAQYLKYLEGAFDGDMELMLAAYNAGPGKVIENRRTVPAIEETRNFIKKVKYFYNKLKKPDEG